jgi:replicative DNA helicase
LRESGTIEQDADAVMFIYRDEYYLQQKEPKIVAFDRDDKYQEAMEKWKADMHSVYQKAELILAKQRHGPTGKIDLSFVGEFTRFGDLDAEHE